VVAPDRGPQDGVRRAQLLVALLILLIAVHGHGGAFHYFIRKDNVLGRMIPRLLRR
jgi:cytochrome b561